MSKFRSLKKKLLAGLCAFASGVSGASAAPRRFLEVAGAYNAKGDSLNFSDEALSKFQRILGEGFSKIAGDFGGDNYLIWLQNSYNIVTFIVWYGDNNKISISVSMEFVVACLGIDSIDIAKLGNTNTANNFLDLEVPVKTGTGDTNDANKCTVRCKLVKILFNDILGFNFNFYDKAKNGEKFDIDGGSAPNDGCHPDLADCVKWYCTKSLSLNGDNSNLDDNDMWRLFTENVWPKGNYGGSLYYRTHNNERMTKLQKAGMGVLGVGTAGGIGYLLFDNLIRRPKEKEVLNRYRKLAEDKAENLVIKTEGKKASKKAKGNGASRRRQGKLRKPQA